MEPTASSWQTGHFPLSIPWEGRPRLPIEPCGDRALQGAEWLADGEANSLSISFGICPGDTTLLTGLGYKRH